MNGKNKRDIIIASVLVCVVVVIIFAVNNVSKSNQEAELNDKLQNMQIRYSQYCNELEHLRELTTVEKANCVKYS